jgi:hypothetical protein
MFSAFAPMLESIMVKRYSGGEYVNGKWCIGDFDQFEISANVQPFPDEQVLQLPEGERNKEHIRVFSEHKLNSVTEGDNPIAADRLCWDGKEFEVQKVQFWNQIITHYEIVAVRIEAGNV